MAALYDAIEDESVPDLDEIADIFTDDIHLNDVGNYFIACVQYATIYRRSPVGAARELTDRFAGAFDAPSMSLAPVLQEIARAFGFLEAIGHATDSLG